MLTETLPNHQYHSDSLKQPTKKVVLINKSTNDTHFCENIPLNIDDKHRLCFSDLINELKPKYPQLNKAFFFIYLREKEYLLGADPYTAPRYIDYKQLDSQDIIILYEEQKSTKKKDSFNMTSNIQQVDVKIEENNDNSNLITACSSRKSSAQIFNVKQEEDEDALMSGNTDEISEKMQNNIKKLNKPREKRVKERTIEYVIQKVKKWRDIYENGVSNELGEDVKPNLDVAAYLVQLSRKTLDDYYAQLRKGEMYGFDFNSNKHQKMGMLRKYVKAQEKSNPNKKNKGKLAEIDSNFVAKLEETTSQQSQETNNNLQLKSLEKQQSVSNNNDQEETMDIESEENQEIQQAKIEEQQKLTYIQAMQRPIQQNNGIKKNSRLGFDYYQYEEIMTGFTKQPEDVCDQFLNLEEEEEENNVEDQFMC